MRIPLWLRLKSSRFDYEAYLTKHKVLDYYEVCDTALNFITKYKQKDWERSYTQIGEYSFKHKNVRIKVYRDNTCAITVSSTRDGNDFMLYRSIPRDIKVKVNKELHKRVRALLKFDELTKMNKCKAETAKQEKIIRAWS